MGRLASPCDWRGVEVGRRRSRAFSIIPIIALVLGVSAGAPMSRAGTLHAPVPSTPNPSSTYNDLKAVDAVSSGNVWAVGHYTDNTTGAASTLILHWNGTAWSKVTSPNPSTSDNELKAVRAISSTNAWAVGYDYNGSSYVTLILHWNGTKWKVVPSPNPSSTDNELSGVHAISSTNAWAVGYYHDDTSGEDASLILHWNGTTWSKRGITNPSPSDQSNALMA